MTMIFSRFVKDESGATAIEYGLIASLISIAAIAAFTTVGGASLAADKRKRRCFTRGVFLDVSLIRADEFKHPSPLYPARRDLLPLAWPMLS